jgi:hypothetical protein
MSVDTKGVIATDCKDVFLISGLIERSLNSLIKFEKRMEFPGATAFSPTAGKYRTADVRLCTSTAMVQITFTFKSDEYLLSVFFDCDCDHLALAPQSISLSIGCRGESAVLMKTALHALSVLGDAHYDYDDCDSVPLARLDEYVPTVMNLLQLRYILAPQVEELVKLYDSGSAFFYNRAFEQLFGAPESWVRDVLGIEECTNRWDHFKQMAKVRGSPPLKFMSEFHRNSSIVA